MKIFKNKLNLWDLFLIINLVSLFGAIVYRFYMLNNVGVFISLILSFGAFYFFQTLKKDKVLWDFLGFKLHITNYFKNLKPNKLSHTITLLYSFLSFLLVFTLFKGSTDNSITSPWQFLSNTFFIIYFLLSILIIIIPRFLNKRLSLFFVSLHFFLSFIVALVVYKIGYGFDPFIHEATINIINEKGFVNPKPLYYLGQYSLIIIVNKTLFIPIPFLNKFLVPILASIFLPRALFDYLEKKFDDTAISLNVIIILLTIPFSFFIMTTPQNLAYLLLIIVIIKSINLNNYYDLLFIYVLSLVALVTQPVAGIPAFLFVLSTNIYYSRIKFRKIILFISYIIISIAIPLSFYLFENTPNSNFSFNINVFQSISAAIGNSQNNSILPTIPKNENFILSFVYLYGFNIKLLIFLLSISGIYISYKHKKECKIFIHFFWASLALFISYILTSALSFSFLVDYERSNYSNRVLIVSALFLLPFIILSFYNFLYSLKNQKAPISIPIMLFIVLILTTSLYITYPRLDNFHNSHGISVGKNDIEATKWIEENNQRQYIVLANQQVSAAALKNYGFSKYFSNNIFYYPIPTSSPLYNYYLDMVYDSPSKKNALNAMELVNVNELYFVLNKYWWAFPKILEEAKLNSDSYISFGEGDVYVFKYTR